MPLPPSKQPKAVSYFPHFLQGDCRGVVPELGQFDFVFADPPFNIGQNYKGYKDNVPEVDYCLFTVNWLKAACEAVRPGGVLALHGPDDLAFIYHDCMKHEEGFERIAWVNWHYRFGQCGRSNWIDSRCHCLIYAKSYHPNDEGLFVKHTWNPEAVLVDSDRVAYGDKRVNETERGGKRLPFNVWGIASDGPNWGRVSGAGSNKERRPAHPNQLPCVYLARLLRAYTDPTDRVLDPFCGSGTSAAVCQELQRHCVTIDVSEETLASAKERCTLPECRAVTRERLGL